MLSLNKDDSHDKIRCSINSSVWSRSWFLTISFMSNRTFYWRLIFSDSSRLLITRFDHWTYIKFERSQLRSRNIYVFRKLTHVKEQIWLDNHRWIERSCKRREIHRIQENLSMRTHVSHLDVVETRQRVSKIIFLCWYLVRYDENVSFDDQQKNFSKWIVDRFL
jgi:hypothetical protein